MRKIITTTFITLDSVMQAPGVSEEEKAGGFEYAGWQMPFLHDETLGSIGNRFLNAPFELLLGKTTYDIFAAFWPNASTDIEATTPFNRTKKYVVSHESFELRGATQFVLPAMSQRKKLKEEEKQDVEDV